MYIRYMPLKQLNYYEKRDFAEELLRILKDVPLYDLYEVSEMSVRLRETEKNPETDIDDLD